MSKFERDQHVYSSPLDLQITLQRMRNYWIAVRLISLVTVNDLGPADALSAIQT